MATHGWAIEMGPQMKRALSVLNLAGKTKLVTIEGMGDKVAITHRDGDLVLTQYMPANNAPAVRFMALAGDLRATLASPRAKYAMLEPVGDALSIALGDDRHGLAIWDGGESPLVAPGEHVMRLTKEQVRRVEKDITFCIDPKEYRAWMTGVYLQSNGDSISFTGTDGHRLVQLRLNGFQAPEGGWIIPVGAWKYLSRLAQSDVFVQFVDDSAIFFSDCFVLRCTLIPESFPDLSHFFARWGELRMDLDFSGLIGFLRSVVPTKYYYKWAMVDMLPSTDFCVFTASNEEQELGRLELPSRCDADLPLISFMYAHLYPVLARFAEGKAQFYFASIDTSTSFVRIVDARGDYIAIVMPRLRL